MASTHIARAACLISASECSSRRSESSSVAARGVSVRGTKHSLPASLSARSQTRATPMRTRTQPRLRAATTTAAAAEAKSVKLESEMDVDYSALETALKTGEFRVADDLTRALLIELAGEDAEAREFVYFTEVANIPVKDLKTIDNLWTTYSEGKFGYSVQRKIWKQNKEQWGKFFKQLDWTTGENNSYRSWANNEYIYSMEAKNGHLPLTSCLRGTQLLRGLLQHPAIAPPAAEGGKEGSESAGGRPDWLKF